jgi:hypothetical protein
MVNGKKGSNNRGLDEVLCFTQAQRPGSRR